MDDSWMERTQDFFLAVAVFSMNCYGTRELVNTKM